MNDILTCLKNSALLYPDKIAIEDHKASITYSIYYKNAQLVGLSLSDRLKGINQPVLILADDSVECLIAFMGVLFSGNFYVPVDSNLPESRLQSMVDSIAPAIIIRIGDRNPVLKGVEIVTYDELLQEPVDGPDISRLDKLHAMRSTFDPVFGMFTSGSTGTPKLVIKNMFSIMDMAKQFSDTFPLDQSSVFGNQAPFYFDVSAKDIYLSLFHSATLYIIPRSNFSFPALLIGFINKKKINTLLWSGFAIRLLFNFNAFSDESMLPVRLVMFSGEAVPRKVIEYWKEHTKAKIVNLYGSTETTFNCTYFEADNLLEEQLPIGIPFRNNRVFIINDDGHEAEPYEKGEICVTGSCLSMGYYNDQAKTDIAFVQNPLNKQYKELMYKTGDIGYCDSKNNIYFVSRKDNQIKHMGYRIELEEIEHAVLNIEDIQLCCCVYDEEDEKIVLFYQSEKPMDRIIFDTLKKVFPKQMLPNRLYYKATLPLNKNGKVDRALLKEKRHGDL